MNRLTFGKYQGRLIKDVFKIDPNYLKDMYNKGLIYLPKYYKECLGLK